MLTREQAEALANLIHLLRPEWDRAGIFTALGKCRSRNELDVAMAAVRAAGDPTIRTPGRIPGAGDHWAEKVATPVAPQPPKPNQACTVCGRHQDRCLCPTPTTRPPQADRVPPTTTYQQARQTLRQPEETQP